MNINELVLSEEKHLKRLQDLVEQAVKEEELLSAKLAEVELDHNLTQGQKFADKIASIGGSWTFISLFFLFLFAWIFLNIYFLKQDAFDPYPFILLNLLLSCLAAIQAPIIMMSQNRKEDKDRTRARNDFMINLKAELEVRNLDRKIDLLISEQMSALFKTQEAQLELLEKIEKKLSKE